MNEPHEKVQEHDQAEHTPSAHAEESTDGLGVTTLGVDNPSPQGEGHAAKTVVLVSFENVTIRPAAAIPQRSASAELFDFLNTLYLNAPDESVGFRAGELSYKLPQLFADTIGFLVEISESTADQTVTARAGQLAEELGLIRPTPEPDAMPEPPLPHVFEELFNFLNRMRLSASRKKLRAGAKQLRDKMSRLFAETTELLVEIRDSTADQGVRARAGQLAEELGLIRPKPGSGAAAAESAKAEKK
jgi:hypothetical protein